MGSACARTSGSIWQSRQRPVDPSHFVCHLDPSGLLAGSCLTTATTVLLAAEIITTFKQPAALQVVCSVIAGP